ncbi:hypothetical protein [Oryza sativa Japonica Group]|uniref:Uncharacterized protein n=1 Tax=Oryza sativa subsp. japonica TaxID=39947 RepID=Q5N9D3_ORYSJ|nr:hypothetical protein [Oryza sativa Japonica Group]
MATPRAAIGAGGLPWTAIAGGTGSQPVAAWEGSAGGTGGQRPGGPHGRRRGRRISRAARMATPWAAIGAGGLPRTASAGGTGGHP